jgi:hypothetical protein
VIGHAHLDERAGLKPADRRLRNAVGPGQIGLGCAFAKTLQCLRPLMGCQRRRQPNFTPRALARARPSPVRAAMRSRSNSASQTVALLRSKTGRPGGLGGLKLSSPSFAPKNLADPYGSGSVPPSSSQVTTWSVNVTPHDVARLAVAVEIGGPNDDARQSHNDPSIISVGQLCRSSSAKMTRPKAAAPVATAIIIHNS